MGPICFCRVLISLYFVQVTEEISNYDIYILYYTILCISTPIIHKNNVGVKYIHACTG